MSQRNLWQSRLPVQIEAAFDLWDLHPGTEPLHEAPTASWVGSVLWNGVPAVLKIPFPHMEGADELRGLRFWNGDPTVNVLAASERLGAMLLQQCLPGTSLRTEPEDTQDEIITALLKRLWSRSRNREELIQFRTLADMLEFWRTEALAAEDLSIDQGLLAEGFEVLKTLSQPSSSDVLLATDLHAGNVLRSGREQWRIIDPKPFVGDRTYDLVQHALNCRSRLESDSSGLVHRLADMAEVDAGRLKLWLFGRTATITDNSLGEGWTALARRLQP